MTTGHKSLVVARRYIAPPGFCMACFHHEDAHREDGSCETEVSDYGVLDCACSGLKLCAACCGDPEAHDLHVCGRP